MKKIIQKLKGLGGDVTGPFSMLIPGYILVTLSGILWRFDYETNWAYAGLTTVAAIVIITKIVTLRKARKQK